MTEPAIAAVAVPPPLLEVQHLDKSFGQVEALRDVSLTVPAGQVTALTGDNGAGKTVLIKCISGIYPPDRGRILWDGVPVELNRPSAAAALGIETVYQDLALCDNLDVVQNMFLGRELHRWMGLDDDAMELQAAEVLRDLSVTTLGSVRQKVGSLSGGQRQSVAIARAVLRQTRLVIMDEPTAALGVAQTEVVLKLVRSLADQGIAVLMISHNLNDVFRVADRIAVLYLGRLATVRPVDQLDRAAVVELMTAGPSARTRTEHNTTEEQEHVRVQG
ncbi:MAG TPA: ATP-binding cassette domain-containing protein [Nocardioides sp.]|nr:ATP-binding cassette domain-containing protein [Nocardioides sp.]